MSLSELALVVAERLPGMATLLVSLMGGVGGAALLEVWWRPKRDRRQAAVILTGEIINNLQLCILHAHARERDPKKVPLDFRLDARGWNAAAGKLAELPPDLVKNVMLLYMRFEALNDSVKFYSEYLDRYEAAKAQGIGVAVRAERALASTLDVFNVGIDKAIEEGKERLAELLPFAGLKDSGDGAPVRSYARAVDDFFREREARISSLLE